MTRGAESFDLFGDGDDVDLIEMAEETFAIDIGDEEAQSVQTFGDLLDLVESKITVPATPVCLLRKAWGDVQRQAGPRLTPRTKMADLGAARQAWIAAIARQDNPRGTPAEILVGAAVLTALASAAGLYGLWPVAILIALCWCVWASAHVIHDHRLNRLTLGEYFRQKFHLHYPAAAGRFGHGTARDRWQALESLCRDVVQHSGPVTRATRFFPPSPRQGA